MLKVEHVPVAEYPGTIAQDSAETFRRKVSESVVPAVIQGLTNGGGGPVAGSVKEHPDEPTPREIVFRGSLDEVQDHFDIQLWSDGLPVVPPTIDRVERFLSYTPREADEILGTLVPESRHASVWSVAVNGVMAGCRPEYMPLLVAAVEALADPHFRLRDAGSTPGWEPLTIVSGPAVGDLGFNTQSGLMRVGTRANTSVGRFVRLYMRNVAGLRTPPGTTDKASIGGGLTPALAEDDGVLRELDWPTSREEQGFAPEDDVVTLQSLYATSQPVYSAGDAPESHLDVLAHFFANTVGPWIFTGIYLKRWYPLLLLNPSVAEVLANGGYDKDRIREYLFEHARVPARSLETYPPHPGADTWLLSRAVEEGLAPPEFCESDDPDRTVPVMLSPDNLMIVVAGDRGRNQSRFYINNHAQGGRTSRKAAHVESTERNR